MDIEGKVAVVTGAGSGIGRASAIALAERGAGSVWLADVDLAGAEETAALVVAAGSKAEVVPTDVADVDAQRDLFTRVDAGGGLDILHNNAGVPSGQPQFPDMPLERIALIADVNLKGVLLGTRAALPLLTKRGGGAIVNTASISALLHTVADAIYGTTKAGIVHFTKCLVGLHETDNIRVNAVLPGIVDTPLLASAPWLEPLLVGVKLIDPAEVAAAVLALIEDDTKVGETQILMNEGVETEFT
jgi:3-oxoacyl-[acyl-carrier protein] reductase